MKKIAGKSSTSWYKWALFWAGAGFIAGLWYAEHREIATTQMRNIELKIANLQELIIS